MAAQFGETAGERKLQPTSTDCGGAVRVRYKFASVFGISGTHD
jgi:hypothetical protein